MKRKTYLLFILLFSAFPEKNLWAQAAETQSAIRKKNYLYLEGGGISGIGSANLERILFKQNNSYLSARVGLGSALINYSLPIVGFNYFVGTTRHFMEMGTSAARVNAISGVFFSTKSGIYYAISPSLGYRYHNESDFILRLNICPIFNVYDYNAAASKPFQFWVGGSLGWGF